MRSFLIVAIEEHPICLYWNKEDRKYEIIELDTARLLLGVKSANHIVMAEKTEGGYVVVRVLKNRCGEQPGEFIESKWVEDFETD